jgi:predicted chitinase
MDVNTLQRCMPGLGRERAQWLLPLNEAAMRKFGITSRARAAMWLAQTGHESVSYVYFEELASGTAYCNRPDLGNTQPGDGPRYKGRGPIQITGRFNYTNAQGATGLPLVSNPSMAADPQHGFQLSAWWWSAHGLNGISDTGDVVAATRRINGGTNGLADRQSRYQTCWAQGDAVLPGGGGDEDVAASVAYFRGKKYLAVLGSDHVPYYKGPDTQGEWFGLKGWFRSGVDMEISQEGDNAGEVSITGVGSDGAVWEVYRKPGGGAWTLQSWGGKV